MTIESKNTERKDINIDESDIENTDNDEDYSESSEDEQNSDNKYGYENILRFKKFYEDNTHNDLQESKHKSIWDDYVFKDKMYRVILIKLDKNKTKTKDSNLINENQLMKQKIIKKKET